MIRAIWQSISAELRRGVDLTGGTDRRTFRHVTLPMALLLTASAFLPDLLLAFAVCLLPYTLIHARRLNDNGFIPLLSHGIVWSVTATFVALLVWTLSAAEAGTLVPGLEFTDDDIIWTILTLGLYLLFVAFEYLLGNLTYFLTLIFAALILFSGFCFTMIGLFGGTRSQPATAPHPTSPTMPGHRNPWRQSTTPSPKRSRHD